MIFHIYVSSQEGKLAKKWDLAWFLTMNNGALTWLLTQSGGFLEFFGFAVPQEMIPMCLATMHFFWAEVIGNLVGALEHFLFFIIFPYIGNNNPNWRTPSFFQRGRYTTNQYLKGIFKVIQSTLDKLTIKNMFFLAFRSFFFHGRSSIDLGQAATRYRLWHRWQLSILGCLAMTSVSAGRDTLW